VVINCVVEAIAVQCGLGLRIAELDHCNIAS